MLPRPWTQRICHQGGRKRDQQSSDGSFFVRLATHGGDFCCRNKSTNCARFCYEVQPYRTSKKGMHISIVFSPARRRKGPQNSPEDGNYSLFRSRSFREGTLVFPSLFFSLRESDIFLDSCLLFATLRRESEYRDVAAKLRSWANGFDEEIFNILSRQEVNRRLQD